MEHKWSEPGGFNYTVDGRLRFPLSPGSLRFHPPAPVQTAPTVFVIPPSCVASARWRFLLKRDVLLPHLVLSFLQLVWRGRGKGEGVAGKAAAGPREAQAAVKMPLHFWVKSF